MLRSILSRGIKLTAARFALPALVVRLVSCSSPSTPTDYEVLVQTDLVTSVKKNSVVYTLTLAQRTCVQTDSLKAAFEVWNVSDTTVSFRFPNIQQFGYGVTDSSGIVIHYQPRIVSPALSTLILPPQGKRSFSIGLSGYAISIGFYTLRAYLLDGFSPHVGIRFKVVSS